MTKYEVGMELQVGPNPQYHIDGRLTSGTAGPTPGSVVTLLRDEIDLDGDLKVNDAFRGTSWVRPEDVTPVMSSGTDDPEDTDRFTMSRTYREVVDATVVKWQGEPDLGDLLDVEERDALIVETETIANAFGIDHGAVRADLVEAHRAQSDPRYRMTCRITDALIETGLAYSEEDLKRLVDAALGE